MTDWILDGLTAGLVLAALLPYLVAPAVPAKSREKGSSRYVQRITIPGRYPILSDSGRPLLSQKEAALVFAEEGLGRFLNRAGAVFGLGMMFMLWELAFGGANILTLTGYGSWTLTINYVPLGVLMVAPFVVELIGAAIVVDARRRMKTPGWEVALGEIAALRGAPKTRTHAVLTEDERKLMEQFDQGEDVGNFVWR